MVTQLDALRGMSFAAVGVRLLLAFLCGGIIGVEREFKRRPAGFRTHILICIGAAITTMTGQYLVLTANYDTDMARLGAQVVAGVGFIGAGTIIVTNHRRVKGLTTAAGLWVAAIVGLAIGAGFYEGGLCVTLLVMIAELILSKLEYYIVRRTPEANLFLEFTEKKCLDQVLRYLKTKQVQVMDMEITRLEEQKEGINTCAIITVRLPRKTKLEELTRQINAIAGITAVDELVSV